MSKAGKTDMNWSQLRDRIDRGETGDKIAVEDPAAAPLGTDAEAGGSATSGSNIACSAAAEQAGAVVQGRAVARPSRFLGLALAAIVAVCVVAALALVLAP